ncbi:hypothetical protein DMUE_0203 [Dictyocoela muelleri]|nr:hypothetical protein DMUE_0203 [Dictyocoela muelleri]
MIYNKKVNFIFIYEISNTAFPSKSFALKNPVNITKDHLANINNLEKEIYDDEINIESIKNFLFLAREDFFNMIFCCTDTHLIGFNNVWKNIRLILRINRKEVLKYIKSEYETNFKVFSILFSFPNVNCQLETIREGINVEIKLTLNAFNRKYNFLGFHLTDERAKKIYNSLKNDIIRKIEGEYPDTILNEWINSLNRPRISVF